MTAINADFTQKAVQHTADMSFVASPNPQVKRKPLDRVGDEIARATSVVRYEPGAVFKPHVHGGGEEILVLDGVLQTNMAITQQALTYAIRQTPLMRLLAKRDALYLSNCGNFQRGTTNACTSTRAQTSGIPAWCLGCRSCLCTRLMAFRQRWCSGHRTRSLMPMCIPVGRKYLCLKGSFMTSTANIHKAVGCVVLATASTRLIPNQRVP